MDAAPKNPGLPPGAGGLTRPRLLDVLSAPLSQGSTGEQEAQERMLAQEQQLHEELRALAIERVRIAEAMQAQIRDLERARTELARREEEVRLDRKRLEEEQVRAERSWRRRLDAELSNLQKESAQLAQNRQDFESKKRQAEAATELERRQLQAAWSQLRQEQEDWRSRQRHEENQLEEQWRALRKRQESQERCEEEARLRLESDRAAHAARYQELVQLEGRIRSHRQRLAALRKEIGAVESRREETHEHPAVLPGSPIEPRIPPAMLELIQNTAQDLLDQYQVLADERQELLKLRQSWQAAWDRGLAELARREQALERQEEAHQARLRMQQHQEDSLRRLAHELAAQQQDLKGREARLIRQQSTLRCERNRLYAAVRARADAARDLHRQALDLKRRWLEERRQNGQRCQDALAAAALLREELAALRQTFRQRLTAVEARERGAMEKELVLLHAEQQLLYDDPNPVAAAKELERRRRAWEEKALWPVRALEREKRELEWKLQQVTRYHLHLARKEQSLLRAEEECHDLRSALEVERARLGAERIRWQHRIAGLKAEEKHLADHVHELESQLEHVTLALLADDHPRPALSLAA